MLDPLVSLIPYCGSRGASRELGYPLESRELALCKQKMATMSKQNDSWVKIVLDVFKFKLEVSASVLS